MRTGSLAAALCAALVLGVAAPGKGPRDYAAVALNVLPPGQSGSLAFPPNATDQAKLYDGLTPLFDNVTNADLRRFYKPEGFGLDGAKPTKVERPRPGVTILRDRWDVPHVYGKTRADVEFGAGYATAEDRLLLMQILRGPGRVAALDVPGLDAFGLANAAREFVPSAQTEAELAKEIGLLKNAGAEGRQALSDVDAYLGGINAYIKTQGDYVPHWTRNDVIAIGALLGGNFGVGGGDETRRSEFLSALQRRLGDAKGLAVFEDLREKLDPEAPVTVERAFPYDSSTGVGPGNVVLDDGSVSASVRPLHAAPVVASNALLVDASRSTTRHPLFVAGPQVGYAFPELLLELDLHGGGIDARGVSFPGISLYVLIGRAKDYAWSLTSANSDIVDHFVETLCGGDREHYMYKGGCRAMGTFDAGVLKGRGGEPDRAIVFRTTVHGPVLGYATVGGREVAIASERSTRGRELLSLFAFKDLNENSVTSPSSFFRAANKLEFTFNWFYADDRHIETFSSGRIPIRAPGVVSGLPTNGNGDYEWRGFLPLARHVQVADPKSGTILNWNNKPGAGYSASDDNWDYGPVQRVELLRRAVAKRRTHTLTSLVAAMNEAATQDLRAVELEPLLSEVLRGVAAPTARAAKMLDLLDAWRAAGGSRLDRDLDGKIDDPGAAIMDAAWPKLADALMSPVLGPLVARLAQLHARNDNANPGGSAYYSGWYGYMDKDLRTVLGKSVRGPYSTRYCGGGDLAACRVSLWAALDAAGNELAAAQGSDPAAWRADATAERITFGLLPLTMRWANRPTFQQVITFSSHR